MANSEIFQVALIYILVIIIIILIQILKLASSEILC